MKHTRHCKIPTLAVIVQQAEQDSVEEANDNWPLSAAVVAAVDDDNDDWLWTAAVTSTTQCHFNTISTNFPQETEAIFVQPLFPILTVVPYNRRNFVLGPEAFERNTLFIN